MSASLAPSPPHAVAAGWRSALENLSPHASPCRYVLPAKWVAMREAAIDFCDRLGSAAHRLGWTAPELFAVHPDHGTLRIDYCGVLMVTGKRPLAVEATHLVFERGSAYSTKAGQIWGIPIWEFARGAGRAK
jgi:hypothetical protein